MHRSARRILGGFCLLLLATVLTACETGANAPLENSIANFQAAATDVSTQLLVRDAQILLPNDDVAPAGTIAYLQFSVINYGSRPDALVGVTVTGRGAPTPVGSASPLASPTIPPAASVQPGVQRITVVIGPLDTELRAGQTVDVSLDFRINGPVTGLLVPVIGAAAAGTFLPSPPPDIAVSPSNAPETTPSVTSTPETTPTSSATS